MAFGCTATKLEKIAKRRGWRVSVNPQGLVQLGDHHQTLYLEGKSIAGYDCDIVSIGDIRTWSNDLAMESVCKDFACNALFYDPHNDTILDPTGSGISDSQQRLLRITVNKSHLAEWFKGNPSKIVRYWKMVLKGYRAVDAATRQDILTLARQEFGVNARLRGDWPGIYLSRMIRKRDQQEFRKLVTNDMGAEFQQKFFPNPVS